ncbi:hypothetical protein FIL92_00525 [SAR202 cluster bacterium AD-812-D07_MRT_10900m]|nr:hypothetical protein [SAR202 cluster bacterium AD-812-D07_MRT_10900m]
MKQLRSALQLLRLLHPIESCYTEFRWMGSGGYVAQRFVLSPRVTEKCLQWLHRTLNGRADVYFGVIPRSREQGTANACAPAATAVWCDYDDAGALPVLPLPPSAVVETSPHKYQFFWLLDRAMADLGHLERLNRIFAHNVGGDLNACDRARVLRLPGFQNLKYDGRPVAKLLVLKPNVRYARDQLEAAFPNEDPAPIRRRRTYDRDRLAPPWLPIVFDAIVDYLEANGFAPRLRASGSVQARCPLHDDRRPSLSLHIVRGWMCHAGCGQGRLTRLANKLGVRV